MEDKIEVTIKGANEQRSQVKNSSDQEGAKLEVDRVENANTQAANPSDDRSLLGIVLDDRAIPLYL